MMRKRYADVERAWTLYLGDLSDEDIAKDFKFIRSDNSEYSLLTETQLIQLVGHAFYHRGQVVMLVADLGGDTVDTDYLFWVESR